MPRRRSGFTYRVPFRRTQLARLLTTEALQHLDITIDAPEFVLAAQFIEQRLIARGEIATDIAAVLARFAFDVLEDCLTGPDYLEGRLHWKRRLRQGLEDLKLLTKDGWLAPDFAQHLGLDDQ